MVVYINNQYHLCDEGMTIYQLCEREHIFIPTLCYIPKKENRAVCRICSVETNTAPGLVPACSTAVQENLQIFTRSSKVLMAQKVIMQLILEEHGQCMDVNCKLKLLAQKIGVSGHTQHPIISSNGYNGSEETLESSDYIRVHRERCIHCDRCIRSCEKGIISRAEFDEVLSMSFDEEYGFDNDNCTLCGDCIHICPAGVYQQALR